MQRIPLNQREPIFSLNDPKRLIELVNLLLLKSVNSTTKKYSILVIAWNF